MSAQGRRPILVGYDPRLRDRAPVQFGFAAARLTGMSLLDTNSDLILANLARDVTHARIDLMHFPVTYYFAPT